jgi:hypothetical protein
LFAVEAGACTVVSDATCFRSPNYPSNYGNNQRCNITVAAHEQVTLSVTAFDTDYTDRLIVNGVLYYYGSGPDGVQVAAGASITFISDGSKTRSGFEICGALLTTPLA